jgi:hypothetical protein
MTEIHFADNLEREISKLLDTMKINYIHESMNNGSSLDFYLSDFNVYIEVKRFHTERSLRQLASRDNIILVQGKGSVEFLKSIIRESK